MRLQTMTPARGQTTHYTVLYKHIFTIKFTYHPCTRKPNSQSLQHHANQHAPPLSTLKSRTEKATNPTSLVDIYNQTMEAAINEMAPLGTCKAKPKTQINHWFTPELKDICNRKRNTESNWKKTLSPSNKLQFTTLATEFKEATLQAKSNAYNTRIKNANSGTKELFSVLWEYESPSKTRDHCIKDQVWCENMQKALMDKITSLKHKMNLKLTSPTQSTTADLNTPKTPPQFEFSPITVDKTITIINGLKPSKCQGDIYPVTLIKECANNLAPFITSLINNSFACNKVPENLKEAWVLPLLKKPTLDPIVPTNYRPISTVPFLLKILQWPMYKSRAISKCIIFVAFTNLDSDPATAPKQPY
ncbi:uncharacterized protein [Ambystoma mexicanum]|uniref:uncharacterized protein n=1 Tax=Ambystoma mexicanum TaxID=8296 RepID=UPI0037E72A91